MTKLVALLGRKSGSGNGKPSIPQQPATAPAPAITSQNKADIELDEDLFFPIAEQLGQENEAVRNLLMDAEHKIGELEIIKLSIAKLVDPVCNTLRDYEEAKSEKLILQRALNTTRDACNKLRDDLGAAEKKVTAFKAECTRLQEIAEVAKQGVAALERSNTKQLSELAAHLTHIAELQRVAQQQASDLQLARDENRRLGERVATADRRTVQLEDQAQTAQQQARQANQERASMQASLDKTSPRTGADFAPPERRRKGACFDSGPAEGNGNQSGRSASGACSAFRRPRRSQPPASRQDELARLRFEAVQARSSLTENLLNEARQALIARADEIRTFERRVIEASTAHGVVAEKLSCVEAVLAERELQINDLEQARMALTEQVHKLVEAATAREGTYDGAQQRIREQSDLVERLQDQLNAAHRSNEIQIENLNAQLQREQLGRSMAEGALEAARKDLSRLLQEIAALRGRSLSESTADATGLQDLLKRAA